MAVPASAQSVVTWTGTAVGTSYSNADNWDPALVPLDGGGNTYRAVIPTGQDVHFDVSGTTNALTALQLDAGTTLTINPGRALTVLDEAAIRGIISAPGGTLTAASGASQLIGNAAQLSATGGGKITLAANAYDTRGVPGTADILYAHGAGSLIDLSSVQTLDARMDAWGGNTGTISALNDGRIDLSSLQTVYGRTGNDRLRFLISAGGSGLDLSGITSIDASGDPSGAVVQTISATNNGRVYLSGVLTVGARTPMTGWTSWSAPTASSTCQASRPSPAATRASS